MKQKIQNQLHITVPPICKLTQATDVEFYIRQGTNTWTYSPRILSDTEMLVSIPYEDSIEFKTGFVKLQFVFKDSTSTPHASEIYKTTIGELLNEGGYR